MLKVKRQRNEGEIKMNPHLGFMTHTRSVTVMLVATSFMFVICLTPSFILELLLILYSSSPLIPKLFYDGSITDPLDHSANLLVYCASSSVFRSKVKDTMCCRNSK